MSDQSCRTGILRLDQHRVAHAGLLLQRGVKSAATTTSHQQDRSAVLRAACKAVAYDLELYRAAFERRREWARTTRIVATERFYVRTADHERLVLGLGNASPLETGLTLHHTYGVPILPGSALKGITAQTPNLGDEEKQLLFGRATDRTSEAGFITFHDAWIHPDSLEATRQNEGLLLDVLTPHHTDYYGCKRFQNGTRAGEMVPPTDLDDPTVISFLSVRGTFHVVLACEDRSENGRRWLARAKERLVSALDRTGVGGKGSSGYGRMIEIGSRNERNE